MKVETGTMEVNGIKYVRADSVQDKQAESVDGMACVIIRTYSAGVFMGYIKSREGKEVELINARRLWYWDGAASLSQMAIDGVSNPSNCKFPSVVPSITLTEAIEILPVSEKAKASIDGVAVWKM